MSTHGLYEKRGEAIIRKIQVPMIRSSTGAWIFAERTHFDYSGCLKGGRYIGVEAKEITADRLQIAKNGLKIHQLNALIQHHLMGALTGVIWMQSNTECYWLSGEFLRGFKNEIYENPYKYIGLELVKNCCPQVMTKDGFIDYLGAALEVDRVHTS